MIARAAEGSARDGLSILDQAIAHGAGAVSAEQVRDMLGLADRGRIRRLLATGPAGRRGRGARRARRSPRPRHRPDAAAARADGEPAFRDPGQGRRQTRTRFNQRRGARERRGDGAAAVMGNDPPVVADAAQRASGRRDRARSARGRRNGAAAADPCGRHARSGFAGRKAERRRRCNCHLSRARRPAIERTPPRSRPTSPGWSKPSNRAASICSPMQLHDQVGIVRYAPPELVLKPMRPLGARLVARSRCWR